MRLRSLVLMLALASTAAPVFAADEFPLQQAEALLKLKQAQQAYDLLAPLEDEQAGNPDYDYLLGMALLDTGDPARAIFAFERCLNVAPNNGPCRVQMARSHLALGETPSARAELQTIQEYNPPPDVQQLVSRYLGAIDIAEKRQQRTVTAYLQAGGGYDSNINNATDNPHSLAAAMPGFTGTNSTAEESGYLSLLAGAGLQYKLSPQSVGLADIGVQNRSYMSHDESSYQTIDVGAGLAHQRDRIQLIGKLSYQTMWLDGQNYRDAIGFLGQYQQSLSEQRQMAAYTQIHQIRYDTLSARDADRFTMGLALSQALTSALSPVFYSSLYLGSENTKDPAADAYSQDFSGLRAGGSLHLNPKLTLNGSVSLEKRKFQAGFLPFIPSLNTPRDETQYDVGLSAAWLLAPHLNLQPYYSYTRNHANIPLLDASRHVVGIDLRYDL